MRTVLSFAVLLVVLVFALLAGCLDLDCPPGQRLVDDSCICNSTLEPPIGGICAEDVCTAEGCPCTFEGILAAVRRGGAQTLLCEDAAEPVEAAATIPINDDVTLDGQGNLVVVGNGTFHVFEARSGTIQLIGMTVSSGNQGIRVLQNADLTLTECVIRENTSTTAAGGGISNQGLLTLVDTTIEDNVAGVGTGGGIHNALGGILTLTRSIVRNNEAQAGSGGGIRNDRGTATITDSEISGNRVTELTCALRCTNGGGLSNENGDVEIVNTVLQGNTSVWYGGGLSTEGAEASVSITSSTLSENKTTGDGSANQGGAIWSHDGAIEVIETTLKDNESAQSGGAFYVEGPNATLLLRSSTVSGNLAARVGGGVRVYDGASATIVNSTIFDNLSEGGGGDGLHIQSGATATVKSSTIAENSTTGVSNISGTLTLIQTIIKDTCVASATTVSLDHNIESPGNSCKLDGANDRVGVTGEELNLSDTLADNGGETQTLILTRPSVAIDYFVGACDQTEDQRGVPRAQGPGCDIGAVELR